MTELTQVSLFDVVAAAPALGPKAYVARRPCGCVVDVVVDDPKTRASAVHSVKTWREAGHRVRTEPSAPPKDQWRCGAH